jgi:hypothetical protein
MLFDYAAQSKQLRVLTELQTAEKPAAIKCLLWTGRAVEIEE